MNRRTYFTVGLY